MHPPAPGLHGLDPVDDLAPFGDPERLLFNVNTPQDLQEAERLMR